MDKCNAKIQKMQQIVATTCNDRAYLYSMQVEDTKGLDISDMLIELNQKGFSYALLGRIFGINKSTVWRWGRKANHPPAKKQRQYAIMLEDMLNVAASMPPTLGDPANHGGPPSNEFSWRATDPPLLKKTLNLMVRYAGVKSIRNREMMDTAGRYIRETYKEYEVKKAHLSMFALAALKVATLKHLMNIEIAELITDREIFDTYWKAISKNLIT